MDGAGVLAQKVKIILQKKLHQQLFRIAHSGCRRRIERPLLLSYAKVACTLALKNASQLIGFPTRRDAAMMANKSLTGRSYAVDQLLRLTEVSLIFSLSARNARAGPAY